AAVTDAQFAALSDQVTGLDFRLDQLDEGLSGGIASAMALGSAAIVPDKNVSLTVSAATYAGEQAFAGQFSGRISESLYVSAGVTGNTGDKKVGARVAATVGF
ncbi:YadA-like family protein, partial [Qipengyuania atrilutea]